MLSPQRGDRDLNMGYWVSGDLVELCFPALQMRLPVLLDTFCGSTIIFKKCMQDFCIGCPKLIKSLLPPHKLPVINTTVKFVAIGHWLKMWVKGWWTRTFLYASECISSTSESMAVWLLVIQGQFEWQIWVWAQVWVSHQVARNGSNYILQVHPGSWKVHQGQFEWPAR